MLATILTICHLIFGQLEPQTMSLRLHLVMIGAQVMWGVLLLARSDRLRLPTIAHTTVVVTFGVLSIAIGLVHPFSVDFAQRGGISMIALSPLVSGLLFVLVGIPVLLGQRQRNQLHNDVGGTVATILAILAVIVLILDFWFAALFTLIVSCALRLIHVVHWALLFRATRQLYSGRHAEYVVMPRDHVVPDPSYLKPCWRQARAQVLRRAGLAAGLEPCRNPCGEEDCRHLKVLIPGEHLDGALVHRVETPTYRSPGIGMAVALVPSSEDEVIARVRRSLDRSARAGVMTFAAVIWLVEWFPCSFP